jgi:hypothetical protein
MFVFCVNNRGLEKYLTLDKKYEVIEETDEFNWFKITNDKDQDTEYDRSRFAWGAKWRDRQLNKLLK